ncbi:MAG: tRNA epoxyqueuosine(34) reductase QueG [Clostridia bacterium]|nr:tRNA epoxyqueuosine(34) reductase QueG [Clostridia bacterium]MBQ8637513.1 tRNA epoxyqueuosine(34) reductase QueG [Clostridia bacterium]
MIERIKRRAAALGISAVGVCRARIFSELRNKLSLDTPMVPDNIEERINPFLYLPEAKSIIACLFSYHNGGEKSNLSLYARGEDYHLVAERKLKELCSLLESEGYLAKAYCDTGALCDRHLAYLAGLGFVGKNRFLINPEFGSYTFIGYILTDAELEENLPLSTGCIGCEECIRACPGGALTESGLDSSKCASYITQKKGDLTDSEKKIIKKSGSVWGCDICQTVCPHNKTAKLTDIDEFRTNLVESLGFGMAESNRDFKKKYQNRAFSWRGYEVIKRNLKITEED